MITSTGCYWVEMEYLASSDPNISEIHLGSVLQTKP